MTTNREGVKMPTVQDALQEAEKLIIALMDKSKCRAVVVQEAQRAMVRWRMLLAQPESGGNSETKPLVNCFHCGGTGVTILGLRCECLSRPAPTPAEPVAKEPFCDKEVGCKKCNWTGPLGAFYEHICADGLIASIDSPTPAAQPTGELGTCARVKDWLHPLNSHSRPNVNCKVWQLYKAPNTPQPVTGAPEPQDVCPTCGMDWLCVHKRPLNEPCLDCEAPAPRLEHQKLRITRERAEAAAREIKKRFDMALRDRDGVFLPIEPTLADIIERAWAGEGNDGK